MSREQDNRYRFAQNLLRSRQLVKTLVKESSIAPGDTVYEIGPGRGIITAELADIAQEVIAVESDPRLVKVLMARFRDRSNVRIIQGDFLEHELQVQEYKVLANIPFNATASIVRKLLYLDSPPADAYLVMQMEAAEKFSGSPHETQFSVLTKPKWRMKTVHMFDRNDFDPAPSVDACLLRFERRVVPIIGRSKQEQYADFVRYGFGRWKENLKLTFKPVFTYTQWKRLCRDLGAAIDATPTELSFEQWCRLYRLFDELVPESKKERVFTWER
jgi:23S rRNA (adenine-N6)-dimethyltransferase